MFSLQKVWPRKVKITFKKHSRYDRGRKTKKIVFLRLREHIPKSINQKIKSINLLGDDWNKPGEPGPAPIILVICEWAVEYEATAAAAAEFAAFGPGEVTLIW